MLKNYLKKQWHHLKLKTKIDQKFTNRHKILKTLHQRKKEKWSPATTDVRDIGLSYYQLTTTPRHKGKQINKEIQYLINEKEIIEEEIQYDDYYYCISNSGTASYYDRKYITKGKKEYRENIYDILKNISTLLLLIMAVITFIGNWISNSKNKCEIENIKTELKQIENSINAKSNKTIQTK